MHPQRTGYIPRDYNALRWGNLKPVPVQPLDPTVQPTLDNTLFVRKAHLNGQPGEH